jgi:hypothetical protein
MSRLSNQITITTAGTAVQGPDIQGGAFIVKAHPDNSDTIWVGNDGDGDVTSSNGFPLDAGEGIILRTPNLNTYWFDADSSGDKACWLRLEP